MTRPIHYLAVAARMMALLDQLPTSRSLPKKAIAPRPEHDPPEVRAARAAAERARLEAQLSAAVSKRARRNAARLRGKRAEA